MTSMSELYNNIKTFILQSFESKREEDINLPNKIESLFDVSSGRLFVSPHIVTDFSDWSGTQPIYSDFILPDNHEITITFKSTPDVQIACSDTSNNWIYAQNIGYNNDYQFSYRTSNNSPQTMYYVIPTYDNLIEYKILCKNNYISFYIVYEIIEVTISTEGTIENAKRYSDTIYTSNKTYDINNVERRIRIYNNANAIDTLTVRAVKD